jgi:hypothetical protein
MSLNHDQFDDMNVEAVDQFIAEWLGRESPTVQQIKETLVRLGYSVQVIYEPTGITVGIVRSGRGQLNSGTCEACALCKLIARMVENGDLPASAAPLKPVPMGEVTGDARQEVPVNQAAEGLRGAEEEGLPEIEGGSDLEQHGKAKKAKKVA